MFQKWFKILKGRHKSRHGYMIQWPNTSWSCRFSLDESCWYGRRDIDDTTGVNKILGRSMGLNPNRNSVRVGWQPVFNKKGEIRLYAYVHEGGQKYQYDIARINTDTEYVVDILFYNDSIEYMLYGESIAVLDHSLRPKIGWKLFPYFGGNSHAPWDMKIFAKKI